MGTVRVFGGFGKPAGSGENNLEFPDISYSGNFLRRIIDYADEWYYEYIFTDTGALTVGGKNLIADLYLVGCGGMGATSPATSSFAYPSPGGGSGFPQYAQAITIAPDEYQIMVGTAANGGTSAITIGHLALAAAKGGDATASNTASAIGVGFEGTYYLYGDGNCPAGNGGGATRGTGPGSQVIPGRGGGGCRLLPFIMPDWGYSRATSGTNLNWAPVAPGYSGFGAGAMGKTPRYIFGADSFIAALYEPNPAPGVVALRVKV